MATPTPAPSITLHPRPSSAPSRTPLPTTGTSPLPQLLQTPTGLALLELQGTFNLPAATGADDDGGGGGGDRGGVLVNIGRVDFPDYRPDSITFDPASTAWMRRVYLFVGQHQRLTGEVKKLPRAVAVVRRREGSGSGPGPGPGTGAEEELEVVEIVKYKVVFSSRPEPVGSG